MTYRKEIDGLRALAVIPVILFHGGFEAFAGGFVGVDVFFVISGYLITTIILNDKQKGTFSLLHFYERRARRILPALFVVMATSLVISYNWMLPDELKNFGQSLVATTVFSNNILLALTSDYWALASEFKPLLHTWSLGVEEQYYLLFPPLMLIGCRLFRSRLALVLAATTALSFAAANWGLFSKPVYTFYLLPTRAWEILLGALTALYGQRPDKDHRTHLSNELLSGLGLCLILGAICLVGGNRAPHGVLHLLAPTLGAVLIITCATADTLVGSFLCWGPLVGIGLMSYSAYLWHQPIFALARVYSQDRPAPVVQCGLMFLTLVLAYLTWRYVETPCRRKDKWSSVAMVMCTTLMSIGFVSFGLYLNSQYGIVSRIYDTSKVTPADLDKRIYNQRVFQNKKNDFGSDGRLNILIVGNSFGRDFVNMTTETFDRASLDIVYRDDLTDCITPFANKTAKTLYESADVIVFASGDDVTQRCIAPNIAFTRNRTKELFYIGTKDFGYNENWLIRLPPERRPNQFNRVPDEVLALEAKVSQVIPSENYISLMGPILKDGHIPITDSAGLLLSVDRAHVTKYGAIFFGQNVLIGSRYGKILSRERGHRGGHLNAGIRTRQSTSSEFSEPPNQFTGTSSLRR